jgi:hypothetical protein
LLAHPEPGLHVAGIKSYGRAPTFLMATGYEQVRSIAADIAGDHEAARPVEFELPETGVCSLNRSKPKDACCGDDAVIARAAAGSCCTAAEQSKEAACCG